MRVPHRSLLAAALAAALVSFLPAPAWALDWPQFRGPHRDDVSRETGLLKDWPAEGPKRAWLFDKGGNGYSGFSIADGRLFTMGVRDGKEILLCLDAAKGTELWAAPMADVLTNKWGDGPRGTPAVDGDRVYALSGQGTLVCATTKDGKVLWSKTMAALGGKTPGWGYTESPLVDGRQVVCTPGGAKGTMAAFDKMTGNQLWQSKDWTDNAQYASIVNATINGRPQYVQLTQEHVAGVDAKTGDVVWKSDWIGKTAVIPTPIVHENEVYVTSGYGAGCKLVKIGADNQPATVYENKVIKNHHGGVVYLDGNVYGYSDGGGWVCQNFETGELVWSDRANPGSQPKGVPPIGKGALSYADGRFYLLDEGKGIVALVEPWKSGWNEHGRLTLDPQSTIRSPQGRIWTHPVIANGRLYLRDQEYIYCFDIKG